MPLCNAPMQLKSCARQPRHWSRLFSDRYRLFFQLAKTTCKASPKHAAMQSVACMAAPFAYMTTGRPQTCNNYYASMYNVLSLTRLKGTDLQDLVRDRTLYGLA